MQLVGKKIVRKGSNECSITVNPSNNTIKLTPYAIRTLGLEGRGIAFGYDDSEPTNKKVFIYRDDENGITLPKNGSVRSNYHAEMITNYLNTGATANYTLNVDTDATLISEYPNYSFYRVSNETREVNPTSIVSEDTVDMANEVVQSYSETTEETGTTNNSEGSIPDDTDTQEAALAGNDLVEEMEDGPNF